MSYVCNKCRTKLERDQTVVRKVKLEPNRTKFYYLCATCHGRCIKS